MNRKLHFMESPQLVWCNGDEAANIGDVVYIINYVFNGGPAPDPPESGDVNCDGSSNVADAVYLINYVFKSGPVPCADCP